MNYELAKQLKDAGFEKKSGAPIFIEDDFFPPSLSELIEVCGKGFHGIYIADNWKAHGFKSDNEFDDIYTMGSTPEEAVANLWLALNK